MTLTRHSDVRFSRARTYAGLAAGLVVLASCSDGGLAPVPPREIPGVDQAHRIHVTNEERVLGRRVRYTTTPPLFIVQAKRNVLEEGLKELRMPPERAGLRLVLRAEVDPPELSGQTIQATHVVLDNGYAYVTYNVQGPVYRGGVDVFDVRNTERPELISQALFDDADVSAVDHEDGMLYLATATGDPGFASPAVLEEIMLEDGRLTTFTRRVDLPSYAATGVRAVDDQVLVTSGDGEDGGLTILGRNTLDPEFVVNFRDARDVAVYGSLAIGMKGTPAELYVVDRRHGQLLRSFAPGGANIRESKSTIRIFRNFVLMAAGDEGTKIVSMEDGRVAASLPAPIVDGIPAYFTVTNAVTEHKGYVFMANGGAGLHVARITVSDDGDATLQMIGQVEFPDGPSVNFVAAKKNVLFLASGEGGLKILEIVSDKDDDDDDDDDDD